VRESLYGRRAPPNSSQKLSRPGAGPPAEPPCQHTGVGGVTAVAVRQSWLRNSSAATAVPRRLRHVGLAVQLRLKPLAGCKDRYTSLAVFSNSHATRL